MSMTKLPLAPLPKTTGRWRSRTCTREACEVCRGKKAKLSDNGQCDGERPCSRCRARGEECRYQDRSRQTKRSLRAEVEEMKDAQRQRDTVLEALTAPGQTHDVLRQLSNGETFDMIYKHLEIHRSAPSITTNQLSDASNRLEPVKQEPPSVPTRTSLLCPPSIHKHPDSGGPEGPETGHNYSTIQNQDSTSNCAKDDVEGPMPPIFSDTTLRNGIYEHDAMDYTATTPFGAFLEQNLPFIISQAYNTNHINLSDDVGNQAWCDSGILDPMQPNYAVPSSTNPQAWPYPQFTATHLPNQAQESHSQSFSAPSSVPDRPPLVSRPSSREEPRRSGAPSTTAAGGSQSPTPPPHTKKRKLSTKDHVYPTVSGTGSSSSSSSSSNKRNESVPQENLADGGPPDQEPPSHDRERHRRASARNWQKQKQQMADLEVAMRLAESRNRELHHEHAEALGQVMDAKNALMDHAKCDHPAISNWLSSQATKYVLKSGAGVEKGQKG
ncbi:hypothetical protein LX36DRAFT_676228 [Colletotrichum falcatum]|nr:hypothetical protein LX36DRAFT_676228 [Colletotrichum falcatum]